MKGLAVPRCATCAAAVRASPTGESAGAEMDSTRTGAKRQASVPAIQLALPMMWTGSDRAAR
jgi:hypothetical protein